MPKGILKLVKTAKGKIIVLLDRQNGKPPMPLSFVTFNNLEHNEKECDYLFDKTGRLVNITVAGTIVFGSNFAAPATNPSAQAGRPAPNTSAVSAGNRHPVFAFPDSINIRETKLPEAVKRLGNFDIDNFALKYQKAARCIKDDKGKDKFFFFKNDRREFRDGRPATGDKFFIRPNYGSLNFPNIGTRQEAQVKALFPDEKSKVVKIKPDWRLICGLSGGIYETNMTLHHVYGVPYIPASSIKGVVRSWIITNVFIEDVPIEESDFPLVNAEYRALKNSKLFCAMFGAPESIERVKFQYGKPVKKKDKNGKDTEKYETEKDTCAVGKEQQGKVVFFDSLPISAPELMPDVINVHYPDWYKEKGYAAPTDFQKTNPVMFLTVTSNSQFQTFVGCNDIKPISTWEGHEQLAGFANVAIDKTLTELAYQWLMLALSNHGIGAKTAVGYGYFKQTPTQ
jgi:CRISPR-associated protein Cmr6